MTFQMDKSQDQSPDEINPASVPDKSLDGLSEGMRRPHVRRADFMAKVKEDLPQMVEEVQAVRP
ncbi:MAG TPA: hypothetical protein VFD14_01475, partial [Clostridia bacterium]|nr:hypothetical protein [Clostridia bacterium]